MAATPRAGRLLDVMRRAMLHALRQEAREGPIIANEEALLTYLRFDMAFAAREQVRALFLNARNELLADEMLVEGTVSRVQLELRDVLHRALDADATAILIVHNHPSGDPSPSPDDIAATRALAQAADALGIALHDHLVIARSGTVSFRASGLLQFEGAAQK
jgi:DNA repair protein RadC